MVVVQMVIMIMIGLVTDDGGIDDDTAVAANDNHYSHLVKQSPRTSGVHSSLLMTSNLFSRV